MYSCLVSGGDEEGEEKRGVVEEGVGLLELLLACR